MKEKEKSAVIRIDENIHEQVRKYCSDNGLKIGFFASQALKAAMIGKNAPVKVESGE
jgi:hypothetical protein